jgi:Flp pilus assembly protein TadG
MAAMGGFLRSERGNVAMMWGMVAAVLIGMIGLTIDFTRAQMIRARLQNAADGAALVAARGIDQTDSQREAAALAFFESEAGSLADGARFTIQQQADGTFTVHVESDMPVSVARLISNDDWTIAVESDAVQSGVDIEVALVLDTTGSMSGSRISDLRAAAVDLVDIVVRDDQSPFYSKVALVPYSMAVNVGSYASSVRGAIASPHSISDADWTDGSSKNISGATRANPVVITSNNHGFSNGDIVWISGVRGMTQINDRAFVVANRSANTFQLQGVNGSSYSNYSRNGTIRRCLTSECRVVVTADNHGFSTNDWTYITGVGGMTQINSSGDTAWQVERLTSDTFALMNSVGPNYGNYSNGGSAYCTVQGCEYFRFTNVSGNPRIFRVSTCVTDRTVNAFTDASPSTTPLGLNYPSSSGPCLSNTIVPLSSDTTLLTNRINALGASGSTAGEIGVAWGWYMLSPSFASLWPSDSQPASYTAPHLVKIAVIMTDGDFNTAYCNGVVSRDSTNGSNSDRINCIAPNGNPTDHALDLCDAMKEQGVIIYTVGFDITRGSTAARFINECATDADHVEMADDGDALRAAFQNIARSISQLRLSR